MVYGGYQDGVANANVLWVASDSGVYLRTTAGGALTKTTYTGGPARDIAVDPTDWTKAYVIDDSHVYYTADAGQTWTDITGNYTAAAGFQTLAIRPQRQDRRDSGGRPPGRLRIPGRQPREPGTSWAPTCPTSPSTTWTTTPRTTSWWWARSAAAPGSLPTSARKSSASPPWFP